MARADDGLMGEGDPSPLDVPGAAPAVLALHGFGGTPLEVELVVRVAEELGLRAHAPLLPGHGTHASELARTGWTDWARGAEEALSLVTRGGRPAIVVGLSLGSLLAVHLAATRPAEVLGLGMLANALRLSSPFPTWPLRVVERLGLAGFSVPKKGADIADPVARATHLTYRAQPVRSAIEVLNAGPRVEPLLARIRVPAFIAHGEGDVVCPVGNAHRAARALGSTDRTVLLLPRSHHIVTRDLDRDLLRSELSRFLRRVAGLPHTPVEP